MGEEIIDKYLITEAKKESKTYKSFVDRIKRAKSANDISKILKDVKKATKELNPKEIVRLADMADRRLEDM